MLTSGGSIWDRLEFRFTLHVLVGFSCDGWVCFREVCQAKEACKRLEPVMFCRGMSVKLV